MLIILLLGLRTTLACVASRDPEDVEDPVRTTRSTTTRATTTTTMATTTPPPCLTCPLPIYSNNCNGIVQRFPCPNAAGANVQIVNSGSECIFQFRCPANTRAFVWPTGRNTPIPYSGTDLVCGGNIWRTTMGLNVETLSCVGPPIPVGCTFCPTIARTYFDCTGYGRMNCYSDPAMISADIQRVGNQCRLIVLCGPGTNFHYLGITGPMGTGGPVGVLTCTMAGGMWIYNGMATNGVTCMSDT